MDRERVDFGKDLPPGVMQSDLDPPPSWDELYEQHVTGAEASRTFDTIVSDTGLYEMVTRIVNWATERGRADGANATEEALAELAVALVDLSRVEEAMQRLREIQEERTPLFLYPTKVGDRTVLIPVYGWGA